MKITLVTDLAALFIPYFFKKNVDFLTAVQFQGAGDSPSSHWGQ